MKICFRCKTQKFENEFSKNRKTNDGLQVYCKSCVAEIRQIGQYDQYSKRKDYQVLKQREYRKTESSKIIDRHYRKKLGRTFNGTVTNLLAASKERAKKKSLPHTLDTTWLKEKLKPMICEATGLSLVLDIDENVAHSAFRPSIDRRDNTLGYTKENCMVVCVIYNKSKSDYALSDVLKMAKALVMKNEQ
jgi:hypothetical protein